MGGLAAGQYKTAAPVVMVIRFVAGERPDMQALGLGVVLCRELGLHLPGHHVGGMTSGFHHLLLRRFALHLRRRGAKLLQHHRRSEHNGGCSAHQKGKGLHGGSMVAAKPAPETGHQTRFCMGCVDLGFDVGLGRLFL